MIQKSKQCVWTVYGQVWCNGHLMPTQTDEKGNDYSILGTNLFPAKSGIMQFEIGKKELFFTHLPTDPGNVWTLYEFDSELERLTVRNKYL